jgi:prophage antirepressor-like protein
VNLVSKFVFPLTNQETRIVDLNGNPWWLLRDVCEVLSIGNSRMVADRLDDDERAAVSLTDTRSDGVVQTREFTIINEAGLYSVILRSDKPEAKVFRRWVTHEVLPQIRKTGVYGDPMKALADPDALRGLLLTYTEKVIALEAKVAEQAPKVEALKRLEGADGSLCVTDAAKALNVRPKALFSHLQAAKWIYKRPGTTSWIGYQDKIQAGLVEVTEYLQTKPDGTEVVRPRARITAKGLARLAAEFNAVPSN